MNDLQIGLAAVGGVLLAGLAGYNYWQTRKNAPRKAADAPASTQQDGHPLTEPMPTALRIEPDLDLSDQSIASPNDPAKPHADPSKTDNAHHHHHADKSDGTRGLYGKTGLSPLIDAIVVLRLTAEVTGDAILSATPGSRRAGSKPFGIEALHRMTKEWEVPRFGQRYTSVRIGIQRANRHGPLNDIEYAEFVVKAQAVADALKATPDFPDSREEVARARELDQFASANDVQLSLTLRATQAAWSVGYIQQCALAQGFLPGTLPGRMVLLSQHLDSGNVPILQLLFDNHALFTDQADQHVLNHITLSLDVAHIAREEGAYQRMLDAIKALGVTMDGVVADDSGQILNERAMLMIGKDIDGMYDTLEAHGFAAGSPLARRLFS